MKDSMNDKIRWKIELSVKYFLQHAGHQIDYSFKLHKGEKLTKKHPTAIVRIKCLTCNIITDSFFVGITLRPGTIVKCRYPVLGQSFRDTRSLYSGH